MGFDIGMKRDGQDHSDEGVAGGIRPIMTLGVKHTGGCP
jgi:hypothetical protein